MTTPPHIGKQGITRRTAAVSVLLAFGLGFGAALALAGAGITGPDPHASAVAKPVAVTAPDLAGGSHGCPEPYDGLEGDGG